MDTLKETQDKQETDDDDDKRWRKWRLTLDEVYDNFSDFLSYPLLFSFNLY